MLDDNLPAFFLKPSSTGVKHHRDFHLSYHGSDPEPAYHLQYADPASPSSTHKNCYAAALFDAYNPDVLFGEVLARPGWTQTGSNEGQGGVASPPQPIMPNEFTIQLYNPDQQVRVEVKSKWSGSDTYEFSMPQDVFRTPSASSLDKGQSDPASLDVTPRINFEWKKEGRFSKDISCYMTGKSTDKKKKSSKKDPDIVIGLWRQMRELTMYEPNLQRVDMEDPKGLEVVLLLSAVVIKDLYFTSKEQMRDLFNISDSTTSPRKLSAGGRKTSNPKSMYAAVGAPNSLAQQPPPPPPPAAKQQLPAPAATLNELKRHSLPKLQTSPPQSAASASQPPPMADPRAQWELDAETARLKAQAEAEAREVGRRRKEKERADEAERKRLQRMVEEEEKAARKRQTEVDKETERLRKMYGVQPVPQPPGRAPGQANGAYTAHSRPYPQPGPSSSRPPAQSPRPALGSNGLYVQPSASASSVMMSGGAGNASSLNVSGYSKPSKKKSFFGLRGVSEEGGLAAGTAQQQRRVTKKGSAMW